LSFWAGATTSDGSDFSLQETSVAVETDFGDTSMGDTSDREGSLVIIGGDSFAMGESTLATLEASATLDPSATTVAEASVTTTALGVAEIDAFASATSTIDWYGDADWDLSIDYNLTTRAVDEDGAIATATSSSYLLALDFENTPSGTQDAEVIDLADAPSLEMAALGANPEVQLDGNVAMLDMSFTAFGEDTFVEVDFMALAVEEQLSLVTVAAVLAVDDGSSTGC
jgi:hypothetical protein